MVEKTPTVDIFLVDTDADTRGELKLVSQACGYTVRSFNDGSQALEALRGTRPRMLVTELLLKGLDGFELCQAVRTRLGYSDLPILCISSIAWGSIDLPDLLQRRFEADFLGKGCLSKDFIRQVTELIGPPAISTAQPPPCADRVSKHLERPLGVKEKQRLESLIRKFEQQISVESGFARRDVRVKQEFLVQFQNVNDLVSEFTHNISAGGVFVRSKLLPPLDEVIQIRLKIPFIDRTLDLQGRVVHQVTPDQAHEAGVPPGFGVEFVDLSPQHRKILNDLINAIRTHTEPSLAKQAEPTQPPTKQLDAKLWIVLLDFPMTALLKVPSFIRRQLVETAEFSDLRSAIDFLTVNRVEAVVIGEGAFRDQGAEALLMELGKWLSPSTERILVASQATELASLLQRKLCHAVLDAALPSDRILDELSSRLGVRIRQSPRVSYGTDVHVTLPGKEFTATMLNISGGGMLFRTPGQVEEGEIVTLEFELPHAQLVRVRGQVVRCTESKEAGEKMVGVAFIELTDEMFLNIRRFVQANVNFRDFFGWIKKNYFD